MIAEIGGKLSKFLGPFGIFLTLLAKEGSSLGTFWRGVALKKNSLKLCLSVLNYQVCRLVAHRRLKLCRIPAQSHYKAMCACVECIPPTLHLTYMS